MSTTTQILFNSPALHSLKREQLVKLCKIHSLKANGKNVDLIHRLRQHAQSLPKDTPLSVAARSELNDSLQSQPMEIDDADRQTVQSDDPQVIVHGPRPSEQWEVVMDSIQEVEENSSQGSLSSQRTLGSSLGYTESGEFGTRGSAASTVTSSLRALATSLGLRRTMAKLPSDSTSSRTTTDSHVPEVDGLEKISKPYSTIPPPEGPPQTDHFKLDAGRPSLCGDEMPLPGHASRPGVPAPPNARLSLGLGLGVPSTPTRQGQPTTTIRLVSNPLLKHDSASHEAGNRTPQLKPFQTTFDISFGSPVPGDAFRSGFGGFALPSDVIDSSARPFIFGSPHHSVSNNQFRDAAASVLEEMNARLRAEGVDEIGPDIINKLHPSRKCSPGVQIKPVPTSKRGEITKKFDEVHRQEFTKMEGIDDTFRRRQPPRELQLEHKDKGVDESSLVIGRKRKSDVLEQDTRSKRPTTTANKGRVSTTSRRPKVIPGGFGLEDEDEQVPVDSRAGKRVRTDSNSFPTTDESKRQQDERELQLEKDKEAIKRKLEAQKARRRSSAATGRKSLGKKGPRPSILTKPKPKPSRFGFFTSAKSLVQSVWNRGKSTTSAPPSNIPKLAAAQTEVVHGQVHASKGENMKTGTAPPSFVPNRKAAIAPAKPTTVTASGNKALAPSFKPVTQTQGSLVSTRASRSRSPLPSFSPGASGKTKGSRASSVLRTSKSRASAGVSSVGTRLSILRNLNVVPDNVGSMGSKETIGRYSTKSSAGSMVSSTRTTARASSRLLAPTASSLAKTVPQSMGATTGDAGNGEQRKSALGSITNSQIVNRASPHGNKNTFIEPLLLPGQSDVSSNDSSELGDGLSSDNVLPKATAPVKRTLSGRKPRISRSKVIAKLASQRAVSGSSVSSIRSSGSGISVLKPRVTNSSGRTRSSIGIKAARASYGSGLKSRSSSGGNGPPLAIGVKRPVRRSEYSRRRSSKVPTEGRYEA